MSTSFAELGSVAEFVNGAAFKPDDWGDAGRRIIRIQNLTDPSKPFNRTTREVPPKLHVQPGDILVSWSASLGVFEWSEPDVALLNQHIFRVLPDEHRVDKRYLRHGLELALEQMQRHLHGATMQHVNRGEFLSTKMYLPPLPEQRRIAEILDKMNALRAKRRAALAQLDTLTQSIFLDMFGDPATNPKGWPVIELGELAAKITDGEHLNPEFSSSGMPIMMAGDVLDDGVNLESAKTVEWDLGVRFRRKCDPEAGDLLLVSRGATIGRQCVVRTAQLFCLMGSVILIKPRSEKIQAPFLSAFLKQPAVRAALYKTSGASAQQAIYLKDLRNLRCMVPPIDLQVDFTRCITAIAEVKTDGFASLEELGALFSSLQHRAFRGNL